MFSGEVNVRIATECKAVDWVIVLSLPPTAKAGGLPLDTCHLVLKFLYRYASVGTGMSDDEAVETQQSDTHPLVEQISEYDEELASAVAEEFDEYEDNLAESEAAVTELEEEVDDLESRLKRKQADFQNYKKRQQREKDRIREQATEQLVERLVGVRGDLKRALEEDVDTVAGLREGVQMTLQEFDRILDAEGVTEIDPEPGTEVDPTRHEVLLRTTAEAPAETVAEVYEAGYEMGEKVLKPAQVTVSTGPEESTDED